MRKNLLRVATVTLAVAAATPITATIAQAQPNHPMEPPAIELAGPTGPPDTVPMPTAPPATCPPFCVKPGLPTALPTQTAVPTLTAVPTATPTQTGSPSSTSQPSNPPRDPRKPPSRDRGTTRPASHTAPPAPEATPSTTPVSATTGTTRPSALPDTGTEWLGTAGVGLMLLGVGILLARSAQRRLH